MKNLSRRRLLRGLGSIAIALPALEIMGTGSQLNPFGPRNAYAQTGFPKRFVVWFTASGSIIDKWRPSGSERDFTLAPILAPLAPHKDQLIVVDGLYQQHANGDAHTDGMGAALTGQPLRATGNPSQGLGYAMGVSLDQVIADHVGADTALKSLELSVSKLPSSVWARLSYSGPEEPIPPEHDPQAVFDRLFSDGAPAGVAQDTQAIETLREQQKSVLDVVADDYSSLSQRLGTEDRKRIDQHFTAIREIETRLEASGDLGVSCAVPDRPEATEDYPTLGKLQMDLLVMALACDRTRVASLLWEHAAQNRRFPFIGADIEHHEGIHNGQFGPVETILTWFTEQQAYLVSKMKEIPEGDGTLLDNTVIFSTSEQANGNTHKHDNMPFLLIGGAGGALQTGRWLRYDGNPPHNNLLVSLMNVMGVEGNSFGNPDWCDGPLPGLVS